MRVLDAGHPVALATRQNIAYWTGLNGDQFGALRNSRRCTRRRFGYSAPTTPTLTTRYNIASRKVCAGDAGDAARIFEEIGTDLVGVLGNGNPTTVAIRQNITYLTWLAAEPARGNSKRRRWLPWPRS